ncbi:MULTISPECIES: N-acetylglucosamine-6-phosphate deacetylase [Bacteria]
MSFIVHSARLVAPTGATAAGNTRAGGASSDIVRDESDAWLRVDGGIITAQGTGHAWRAAAHDHDRIVDAAATAGPGAVLTPGLIDIHVHGGGGASYDGIRASARGASDGGEATSGAAEDDPDAAIVHALATHAAHGTTRAVLSLVTAPVADLERRVRRIARLSETQPGILGSHLEGPFLDHDRRGAHDPADLRAPNATDVERLLGAGAGTVRQVTLAPENPGAIEAIRQIVATGAAAAIGHTGADAATARAAFDAGATIVTHAFNAMPGLHHREPGPVAAAAIDERVTLEVIADGVHLDPAVVRLLFRMAPGRIALITDAMAAAGADDRDANWLLGSRAVEVRDGIARLRGSDTIAGSTLTSDRALRVAIRSGVPLTDAVRGLTATPARAVGHPELGTLDGGAPADLVLWDRDFAVRAVWRAGEPVPRAGAS